MQVDKRKNMEDDKRSIISQDSIKSINQVITINRGEGDEDYLDIRKVKSTRRLLVIGPNVKEFAKILVKATVIKLKLETSPHQDTKGIIRFKSSVSSRLILKTLENSSLQLKLFASKLKSSIIKEQSSPKVQKILQPQIQHENCSSSQLQKLNDPIQNSDTIPQSLDLDYIAQLILIHPKWTQLYDLLSHIRSNIYDRAQEAKLWLIVSTNRQQVQNMLDLHSQYVKQLQQQLQPKQEQQKYPSFISQIQQQLIQTEDETTTSSPQQLTIQIKTNINDKNNESTSPR